MLSIRNITYSHPGAEVPFLSGCSLAVRPGVIVAVAGGRGCGKSTLARIVVGDVDGYEGEVVFGRRGREGADVVLIGEDTVFRFSTDIVSDEIAHRLGERGIVEPVVTRRVREALSLVGISHLADVKVQSLSHVETMLVALAYIVAMRARYVVIDCVDALLGVEGGDGSEVFRRALDDLRQRGSRVLLMTRRLSVVNLADECAVLDGGRIVWSGDPGAMTERDGLAEAAHIAEFERLAMRQPDRLPPLGAVSASPASVDGRLLEMKDVTLMRSGIRVLSGVDMSLRPGRVTLIAGRYGDGKTSISLVASAVLGPDTGSVTLGGIRVRLGVVGLMPEDATCAFFANTVVDDMGRFLRLRGVDGDDAAQCVKTALADVGLDEMIMVRPISELSTGERRLAGLARLLTATDGYEVVVLDEPTDGLDGIDAEHVRELVARLARRGVAVAVTSRNPVFWLSHVEDVVFLREGAVTFLGTRDECVGSAMPWVKSGLPVPRWLFDPQPPLGRVWGSTEGRAQLAQDSGLREPETTAVGSYGDETIRYASGGPNASAGAQKGSVNGGRRMASVLRMRAARPHAKGGDGYARPTWKTLVWAVILIILALVVGWQVLPIMVLCVGVTCAFCRLGLRDVVRLSVATIPVLAVASLVVAFLHGGGFAKCMLSIVDACVRLELVFWVVGAVARVSTPADVARLVCMPLAPLRGLGVDVGDWELALARRLRIASLYTRELGLAMALCRIREGAGRQPRRREHEVTLSELRALARERAERHMI